MVVWDLLNTSCCCPWQCSHSSGRLWQGQSQGRAQTALTLQCCSAGCAFSFVQIFVPELSAKWLLFCGTAEETIALHHLLWSPPEGGEGIWSPVSMCSSKYPHLQSLRLSRMISDKTGELKLPYVWFWMASLRFLCYKNGQVAIRSSLSSHKIWRSHGQDAFLGSSWCLSCAMPQTAALINLQEF